MKQLQGKRAPGTDFKILVVEEGRSLDQATRQRDAMDLSFSGPNSTLAMIAEERGEVGSGVWMVVAPKLPRSLSVAELE